MIRIRVENIWEDEKERVGVEIGKNKDENEGEEERDRVDEKNGNDDGVERNKKAKKTKITETGIKRRKGSLVVLQEE